MAPTSLRPLAPDRHAANSTNTGATTPVSLANMAAVAHSIAAPSHKPRLPPPVHRTAAATDRHESRATSSSSRNPMEQTDSAWVGKTAKSSAATSAARGLRRVPTRAP